MPKPGSEHMNLGQFVIGDGINGTFLYVQSGIELQHISAVN